MQPDYYGALGVPSHATPEEIKQAYRALALRWHPDRFTAPADKHEAHRRFCAIGEAYAVLSDPASRADYDARRASGHSPSPSGDSPFQRAASTGRQEAERSAAMSFPEFQGVLDGILRAGGLLASLALYGVYRAGAAAGNALWEFVRPETDRERRDRLDREARDREAERLEQLEKARALESAERVRRGITGRTVPRHRVILRLERQLETVQSVNFLPVAFGTASIVAAFYDGRFLYGLIPIGIGRWGMSLWIERISVDLEAARRALVGEYDRALREAGFDWKFRQECAAQCYARDRSMAWVDAPEPVTVSAEPALAPTFGEALLSRVDLKWWLLFAIVGLVLLLGALPLG